MSGEVSRVLPTQFVKLSIVDCPQSIARSTVNGQFTTLLRAQSRLLAVVRGGRRLRRSRRSLRSTSTRPSPSTPRRSTGPRRSHGGHQWSAHAPDRERRTPGTCGSRAGRRGARNRRRARSETFDTPHVSRRSAQFFLDGVNERAGMIKLPDADHQASVQRHLETGRRFWQCVLDPANAD